MQDPSSPISNAETAGSSSIGAHEALHDVSNALTVVLGWLEEVAREDLSPDEVRRAAAIATRKAREARALAREAIGGSSPHEVARSVAGTVREAVDALSVESARAGVTMAVDDASGGADAFGASALGHVVTNLLLNALAFAPAGSTIRVRIGADAQRVRIRVEDEGPGVDPHIVGSLFEGRTSRPGGAGIGLRHAREMVRRLGGDLVHVHEGLGATFEVVLPRHRPTSPHGDAPRSSASSQSIRSIVNGARVLVVEDDRAVCALLDAGLGARGVEVVALHDGHDLSRRLSALGAFDAVLLDLSPIAADVAGSISAVRSALPDAGIVFISGSAVALESELDQAQPRTRWVRKPFEVSEITQAIAELLPARRGA